MRLSVVIPVYNEEGNIGRCITAVREVIGAHDEIIVVDDGSSDGTADEAGRYPCVLLCHEHNRGKGASVRTGIAHARGRYIALIDGDGQDDPKELLKLISAVEQGADLALGSRFSPASEGNGAYSAKRFSREAVLPVNELGNKAVTFLFRCLFGGTVTDICASFRVYRAEALKRMTIVSDRYELEVETMVRAVRMGLNIVEVPVHRYARSCGRSQLYQVPFGRTKFAIRVLAVLAKGYFCWR